MADKAKPRFSEGEDGDRLMAETTALLQSKWTLDEGQQGIEKTFNFPTYAKAFVSHFLANRNVAKTYLGLHTTYWIGDQASKPSP